ncbi:hypothetical protein Ddc_01879 [Ditylenchus destructor]|nr:hypothetical protein Ddc_01879 [Ditylenchus destructor]
MKGGKPLHRCCLLGIAQWEVPNIHRCRRCTCAYHLLTADIADEFINRKQQEIAACINCGSPPTQTSTFEGN